MAITLDVFDTVVTRALAQPTHVFAHMEKELVGTHGRVWRGFAVRRVLAEQDARAKKALTHPGHDVTLDEILHCLSNNKMHPLDLQQVLMLNKLEHTTEVSLARPVKFGCEVAHVAHAEGTDVFFVSDNYMSSHHIVNMLHAVGLDWVTASQVYVSCEHGAMKEGSLWDTVARDLGVSKGASTNSVLHFGDNVAADIVAPRQRGFSPHHNNAMTLSHREMVNTSPAVLPFSHIEAWQRDFYAATGWQSAEAIGSGLIAMVVASQVKDMQQIIAKRPVAGVHFVARDGYMAHHVWNQLRESGAALPPASYMAFSRSVVWRAQLKQVNDVTIARFIGHDELLSIERLERRVGCALESQHARIQRLSAIEARAVLVHNATAIVAASAALRARMLGYLKQCGILQPGHHVVIDLGWTGSSIADLADLVREETNGASTIEGRLTGTYWDASANRTRVALHGYAMDEFHSVDDNLRLLGMLKMLEVLVTAPHGSVIGYDGETKNFEPIFASTDVEVSAYDEVVGEISRAAIKSAQLILTNSHPSDVGVDDITRESVWAAMMQVGHTPHQREVTCLQSIRQVSAIDHEGDGLSLMMQLPKWVGNRADPTRITEELIHGHWVQGTLTSWENQKLNGWLSNIRRVLPFLNKQWVEVEEYVGDGDIS